MALTDFYTSNLYAYRGICPIDLTNTYVLSAGWVPYGVYANVYQTYFPNYAPKVVAEQHSTRALYGKPYIRALDLQTLGSLIHGGFFYDTITKNLYVKCFDLAHPNTVSINVSNLQGIEARIDSYYIHQNLRLTGGNGVRFEAIVGLGEHFIDNANIINSDDFYFACLVVDPEPGDLEVTFPSLESIDIDGVKFPGSKVIYHVTEEVPNLSSLAAIDLETTYVEGQERFVNVLFVPDSQHPTAYNVIYRYVHDATWGDVKPTDSDGSGDGLYNGWWNRVYGVDLEVPVKTANDIAELKSLPFVVVDDGQLRQVESNGLVYRYDAYATTGTVQPLFSNGLGQATTGVASNGWWVYIPSTHLEEVRFVYTANHQGLAFTMDSGVLGIKALAIQEITPHEQVLQTLAKGSFKMILEIFPRKGAGKVLDYTLQITDVTDWGTYGTPAFYSGTVIGLPSSGSFSNYLVGFSIAEGVIVDDLIVSEIVETVA
jgi:hypothetical protein